MELENSVFFNAASSATDSFIARVCHGHNAPVKWTWEMRCQQTTDKQTDV